MRLLLTQQASANLDRAQQYSLSVWGERRCTLYMRDLFEAIALILVTPGMGVARSGVNERARAVFVREHIIVYQVDGQHVEIVRVLHRRQRTP